MCAWAYNDSDKITEDDGCADSGVGFSGWLGPAPLDQSHHAGFDEFLPELSTEEDNKLVLEMLAKGWRRDDDQVLW